MPVKHTACMKILSKFHIILNKDNRHFTDQNGHKTNNEEMKIT
jgi:hypothetical protein